MEKSTDNKFQMELSNLSLETVDELNEFEKKLTTNKEFRMKLVSELKRFSCSTLLCTECILMRQLFKDVLLEKFSYKGLKKKVYKIGVSISTASHKLNFLISFIASENN